MHKQIDLNSHVIISYYNINLISNLMDSLDDLSCPVCMELSRDAVESDCCGHAFCDACADLIKNKQNECPLCKESPFACHEGKLIRRMISGIKVACPNEKCEQKVANADLPQHLEYCLFSAAKCRVCGEKGLNKEIVQHSIEKHEGETQRALIDYHSSTKSRVTTSTKDSKLSQASKVGEISPITELAVQQKNRSGKMAAMGTSGKYYCGGPLRFKCSCCDGSCGTTNGENCVDCMELDMRLRGLRKGFLVNSGGVICRVDLSSKTVYCGILLSSFGASRCVVGNTCKFCGNLQKTLPRYQSLCKE